MIDYDLCINCIGGLYIKPTNQKWERETVLIHNVQNIRTIVKLEYDNHGAVYDSVEIVFTCNNYQICERKFRQLMHGCIVVRYRIPSVWLGDEN